ncbi:hypothetical protein D3C86_1957260 [compost metagenome]
MQVNTRNRKRAPANQKLNQGSGGGFGAYLCTSKPLIHRLMKQAYPLTKCRDIRFGFRVKGGTSGMLMLQFFQKTGFCRHAFTVRQEIRGESVRQDTVAV